jgi:MFS transporter, NNP family, nitrate/nitrite transporter
MPFVESSLTSIPPQEPEYFLEVVPEEGDRAREILLLNFSRPHMRAFHCSWWSFFVAFFIWFNIAPLIPYIKESLDLSRKEIWTANMAGLGGTVISRLVLGALCDKYGARTLMSMVLCVSSIPTAMTGLIDSATGLVVLRGFIGLAGGSEAMCQFWMTEMFTQGISGTAIGISSGFGNMGGALTQLVIGGILTPLVTKMADGNRETAWRTVSIIPAAVAFATGIFIYCVSDDTPKGKLTARRVKGSHPASTFISGSSSLACWMLFIQYGCSLGVELTMYSAGIEFFEQRFGQSPDSAYAFSSIFGWMAFFGRGMGGYLSDEMHGRYGMRGRLWAQGFALALQGLSTYIFTLTNSLGTALGGMIFFSICVQLSEGSTFGIVPYVNPTATGAVVGIVGAGGPAGAILFSLAFRDYKYETAFYIMAICAFASSFLIFFIFVEDHASCCGGKDLDQEEGYIPSWKAREDDDYETPDAGKIPRWVKRH